MATGFICNANRNSLRLPGGTAKPTHSLDERALDSIIGNSDGDRKAQRGHVRRATSSSRSSRCRARGGANVEITSVSKYPTTKCLVEITTTAESLDLSTQEHSGIAEKQSGALYKNHRVVPIRPNRTSGFHRLVVSSLARCRAISFEYAIVTGKFVG